MNGVSGFCQFRCWVIGVELLIKLGCGQGCCTSTPTCVANVFGIVGCREIMSYFLINRFNLSFTRGQFLRSCPICWRYANDNVTSMVECMFGTNILHWTNGRSTIPITSTFDQTFWLNGCTFRTTYCSQACPQ